MRNSDLSDSSSEALSVSGAMALAKGALEGVVVRLVGEVSELSNKPGYKAVYFTVKDEAASLPCMMWNNRFRAADVDVRVGSLVELTGRFTLYAAKGRMNFDVFSLALAGEGDLRLRVANLAKKLAAEGLMDPSRKRAVPAFPENIGVVTSPRGAAVHDVLRTLRRRFPLSRVLLAGVPVEGGQAPSFLIEGIRCVVDAGAEVVLVVRGGGSFEDLMPFNDERLAREIAACPVPVVTGIGHEPDTSIADMVSDLRASTPTAAAEAVSASRESLEDGFARKASALKGAMDRRFERTRGFLGRLSSRPVLSDSQSLFAEEKLALDYASERLFRAIPLNVSRDEAALAQCNARLRRLRTSMLDASRIAARMRRERLLPAGDAHLRAARHEMGLRASRLHDLSPLAVIGRGYAIARNASGDVVKSIGSVDAGDTLNVSVSDGLISCRVEGSEPASYAVVPWEENE